MLKLQFRDQRQPAVWLVESVMTIGSGPRNHVVINESGIDELHARLTKEGDNIYLSDNGSFGGTFVNGNKIGQHFQLRPGDKIRVGKVELEIIDPKAGGEKPAAASAPRADWSLMAITGELKGKSIPVHGTLVFGRSSSCDIVINDAHMSRRHAEVNLKDGILRLVDLKSSNGTCVNGKNVGEQILKPGDKISFDQVTFLVAGPANAKVELPQDDDDESTVFRAAPIPRRPQAAAPKPAAPAAPAPSARVEAKVSAAPAGGSRTPMMVGVVAVVLVIAIAVGFMLFK
jgi:pSer/pThr/pTyr-binding forkhead associated (FHA) protein